MGVHKDQHDKPCTGILEKKDVKARKWRQKQYLMDLTSLSVPGCFARLQGEKITFLS